MHGDVVGLRFRTATHEGTTSATGEFLYEPGETVTFLVGDIALGDAEGQATITAFELAGMPVPSTVYDQVLAQDRVWQIEATQPMDRAVNIAVFLQSIDHDGDPANGIAISEAMHTAATGMSLEIDQPLEDFFRSYSLRRVMAAGRAAAVWNGPRPVFRPAVATNALLAAVGVEARLPVQTRDALFNGDDEEATVVKTATHDEAGHALSSQTDFDAAGIAEPLLVEERRYNEYGALTYWMTDRDGDPDNGVSASSYLYDESGYLVELIRDCDLDEANGARRYTFTVDEEGNRTQRRYVNDSPCGSPEDELRAYSYDAEGRITREDLDTDPSNDDGYEGFIAYLYDDAGNLVRIDRHTATGMALSQRERLTYDEQNRLLERRREGPAGQATYLERWTYDGLTRVYRVDADGDPGNGFDRFVDVFDDDGRVLLSLRDDDDADDNGIVRRRVYTYADDGLLLVAVTDSDLDDANGASQVQTLVRDASGRLLESIYDEDDDRENGIDSRYAYETTDLGWGSAYPISYE